MQDISCLVLPIPAHAFFKQAVLQGEIGHHLLQGGGFTTKVLHLAGRRGAGGVARQPALAGLQELLRPAVTHRGGNAFPAAQLRDVLLAAQSPAQCGSSLRPNTASASPGSCREQASRAYQRWKRISVSSSLLVGCDEPETLRSSSCQICLTGAEAGQAPLRHRRWEQLFFLIISDKITN